MRIAGRWKALPDSATQTIAAGHSLHEKCGRDDVELEGAEVEGLVAASLRQVRGVELVVGLLVSWASLVGRPVESQGPCASDGTRGLLPHIDDEPHPWQGPLVDGDRPVHLTPLDVGDQR